MKDTPPTTYLGGFSTKGLIFFVSERIDASQTQMRDTRYVFQKPCDRAHGKVVAERQVYPLQRRLVVLDSIDEGVNRLIRDIVNLLQSKHQPCSQVVTAEEHTLTSPILRSFVMCCAISKTLISVNNSQPMRNDNRMRTSRRCFRKLALPARSRYLILVHDLANKQTLASVILWDCMINKRTGPSS